MARLSKAQIKAHNEACGLLTKEALSLDEREFVIDNWQESALHINSAAGAFFTPLELAFHLALEIGDCRRIIDVCAGIGALAFAASYDDRLQREVVCVEVNPAYVEVGRKVVPHATWICASVDAMPDMGRFEMAIGNPPFGKTAKIKGPRYSGEDELAVIDIVSDIATFGTFIIPQMSAPFEYSGRPDYKRRPSAKFDRFHGHTGIDLEAGCGVDCETFKDQWRGVSPKVEIVTADFSEVQAARRAAAPMPDLFEVAA